MTKRRERVDFVSLTGSDINFFSFHGTSVLFLLFLFSLIFCPSFSHYFFQFNSETTTSTKMTSCSPSSEEAKEAAELAAKKDKYFEKLCALNGLGFHDEARCLKFLDMASGSLEGAIVLMSKYPEAKPAPPLTTAAGKDDDDKDEDANERVTLHDLCLTFPRKDRDDIRTIHTQQLGNLKKCLDLCNLLPNRG